jgi:hypothetical protein
VEQDELLEGDLDRKGFTVSDDSSELNDGLESLDSSLNDGVKVLGSDGREREEVNGSDIGTVLGFGSGGLERLVDHLGGEGGE